MTFRGDRKQTLLDFHLDPANYAEVVIYTPVGGAPRNVTIHAEAEKDYTVVDPFTGDEKDELIAMCCRDAAATATDGTLRGGIDAPKIGDRILRHVGIDPRQEVYTFRGEIRDEKQHKWRLVFERRARPDQGVSS